MLYKNEDRYEGEFKKNKRKGEGKMWFKNGAKFEGEWKDDRLHGQGK